MIRPLALVLSLVLSLGLSTLGPSGEGLEGPAIGPRIEVCFSPGEAPQKRILEAIGKAQATVLVQAYTFTSEPIAKALLGAKSRGVAVRVLLDKTANLNNRRSQWKTLLGIEVRFDSHHPIAHNKVMILDDHDVLTGSYNYSNQAMRNAENLLLIHSPSLAREYRKAWEEHWAHSEPSVASDTRAFDLEPDQSKR